MKYADKMQQETINKVTEDFANKIDDLKKDICEHESKRLTLEKSFNDLNKSIELNKSQLKQEAKEKYMTKADASKEFLTKKDMSNLENNMKAFDKGAKIIGN